MMVSFPIVLVATLAQERVWSRGARQATRWLQSDRLEGLVMSVGKTSVDDDPIG